MFTGLIEDVGTLASLQREGRAACLTVTTGLDVAQVAVGDSVSVNGACLTVAAPPSGGLLTFHTLGETLDRTNLGSVPMGGEVNLERALRLGDRLGGHLVSGHVDTTAPVRRIGRVEGDYALTVGLPSSLAALVIPKGSIAVDGISLTLASLQSDAFEVRIIPHTWAHTNLRSLSVGDRVNLEADLIGKYILRSRQVQQESVDMETLARAGFL